MLTTNDLIDKLTFLSLESCFKTVNPTKPSDFPKTYDQMANFDTNDSSDSTFGEFNRFSKNSLFDEKAEVKFLTDLLCDSFLDNDCEEPLPLTKEQLLQQMKSKTKSKQFQQRIESLTADEVHQVHGMLFGCYQKWILKDYGNYSVISILKNLDEMTRIAVINSFKKQWCKFANHGNASLVVQYLIKSGSAKEVKLIFSLMRGKVKNLAKANLGSYCVQFLLDAVVEPQRKILIDEIIESFEELALHDKGKFVVFKALEFALSNKNFKAVKKEIIKGQTCNSMATAEKLLKSFIENN